MAVEYMRDLEKRYREERAATMHIRIYSYENRISRGIVMSMLDQKEVSFSGLDQMLLIMEDMLDQNAVFGGIPDYRTIDPAVSLDGWLGAAAPAQMGKCPQKFAVRVYGRQKQSLQGELRAGDKRCYFRSGMELMRLMHQWLQTAQGSGYTGPGRKGRQVM